MKELIVQIENLKKQFEQLKPLKPEHQLRLDKKFRLEWNYNSNHIEGNTLTYSETELLLIFGQTKGNHELREYEEMKGHDVALKLIEDLAADKERTLTENFIREINGIILREPFYKEAITPDGQPTRRLIKVGEYKSFPNSVRLQNGEMFHYASPQETPAKMSDLLSWYQEVSLNTSKHPIEIAAELHYRFVCIHPFDDGNGRISRLIMNYHLLKNGFPPVIIKSEGKKDYLFALHEADTGNIEAFIEFVGEQLLWSYDISMKAAKGESVDEAGDWRKKVVLLQKKIDPKKIVQKKKSDETIRDFLNFVSIPLAQFLLNNFKPVTDLFFSHSVKVEIRQVGSTSFLSDSFKIERFFNGLTNDTLSKVDSINYFFRLENFKQNGSNAFTLDYKINIVLNDFNFTISIVGYPSAIIQKLYHENIIEEDLEIFANKFTNIIVKTIEDNITNAPN